jgi:hypothetical protein
MAPRKSRSPSSTRASPQPKRKRGGAANQAGNRKRVKKEKAIQERDDQSEVSSVAPSAAPTQTATATGADEESEENEDDEDDVLQADLQEDVLAEQERTLMREGLACVPSLSFMKGG